MRLDQYGRLRGDTKGWRATIPVVVVWAGVLTLYVFYVPNHVSPLKLPGPEKLLSVQRVLAWGLLTHSLYTLGFVIVGFVIGCVVGTLVAMAMFAFPLLRATLHGFIEVIRPIPPIALVPFFILWFHLNPAGQVVLIALGSFMVMLIGTIEALQRVSTGLRRAARSLGVRGSTYYWRILLPAISPDLIGPMRVALALAFALGIAAEFMGAQRGLGFLMMVARRTLHTETILLGIVIIGVESALLDQLLRAMHRRWTRWAT